MTCRVSLMMFVVTFRDREPSLLFCRAYSCMVAINDWPFLLPFIAVFLLLFVWHWRRFQQLFQNQNHVSNISRRCLVATGSSMLTCLLVKKTKHRMWTFLKSYIILKLWNSFCCLTFIVFHDKLPSTLSLSLDYLVKSTGHLALYPCFPGSEAP